jgi:hypothetical protein
VTAQSKRDLAPYDHVGEGSKVYLIINCHKEEKKLRREGEQESRAPYIQAASQVSSDGKISASTYTIIKG